MRSTRATAVKREERERPDQADGDADDARPGRARSAGDHDGQHRQHAGRHDRGEPGDDRHQQEHVTAVRLARAPFERSAASSPAFVADVTRIAGPPLDAAPPLCNHRCETVRARGRQVRRSVGLDGLERRVVAEIADARDELVALVCDLIAFDTTARALRRPAARRGAAAAPPRRLLERHGADIDLWEPAPEDVDLPRMLPPGLRFDGRPQLSARFAGAGGGRSLLLNGHVDVVSAEPRSTWTSDPLTGTVRDGRLYGRGACDMKGGVGAMVFAAIALARAGVRLRGDLLVCTTTDEESFGAGGVAAVRRGVRADAAIVTEASGGDVWYACRGSLNPRLVVEGRPGHAGVHQPHWRDGGAVNAIHKTTYLLDGLRRLEEEWRTRADSTHPDLGPTDCVPTTIAGGDWFVSHPATCVTTLHIAYVPGMADADGWGSRVEAEVEQRRRDAGRRRLLARGAPAPPGVDVRRAAVGDRPGRARVHHGAGAVADVGWQGRPAGTDFWHDGATFALLAGMPVVCLGPGAIQSAHTVDEHVEVDDLVRCAAGSGRNRHALLRDGLRWPLARTRRVGDRARRQAQLAARPSPADGHGGRRTRGGHGQRARRRRARRADAAGEDAGVARAPRAAGRGAARPRPARPSASALGPRLFALADLRRRPGAARVARPVLAALAHARRRARAARGALRRRRASVESVSPDAALQAASASAACAPAATTCRPARAAPRRRRGGAREAQPAPGGRPDGRPRTARAAGYVRLDDEPEAGLLGLAVPVRAGRRDRRALEVSAPSARLAPRSTRPRLLTAAAVRLSAALAAARRPVAELGGQLGGRLRHGAPDLLDPGQQAEARAGDRQRDARSRP